MASGKNTRLVDFRVFDSVGKLLVRSLRSGFITLSRLPTASFLACTRTPCIIYVLRCICVHTSERLDGEQGLTTDGLGTPFARAQPRLGKHLQHSFNVRIVCIYCTSYKRYISKDTWYRNFPRIYAKIAPLKSRNNIVYSFNVHHFYFAPCLSLSKYIVIFEIYVAFFFNFIPLCAV